MSSIQLYRQKSALLVIDLQSGLAPHLFEGDRVISRTRFLVQIARLLEIPLFVTEQNPSRMGQTVVDLEVGQEGTPVFSKMAFGIGSCPEVMAALRGSGRTQMIVAGVETHICVGLSVVSLLENGFETVVCPDATGARSNDRHRLGMERIRDAGAVPIHSEGVAYEWLGSADDPKFREALAIVKAHP